MNILLKTQIKINESPIEMEVYGEKVRLDILVGSYQSGGIAVMAIVEGSDSPETMKGERWGNATVWLTTTPNLPDWEFYVKESGENELWVPKLMESPMFISVGKGEEGSHGIIYRQFRFSDEVIKKIKDGMK